MAYSVKLKTLFDGSDKRLSKTGPKLLEHLAQVGTTNFNLRLTEDIDNNFQALVKSKLDEVTIDLWEAQLEQNFNTIDGNLILFPDGLKFLWTVGENVFLVIEEKPQIRTILWGEHGGQTTRYRISLPYNYFVLGFKSTVGTRHDFRGGYICWSKKPLLSFEDLVYKPSLPDINENSLICMGGALPRLGSVEAKEIPRYCQDYIAYFWNAQFDPSHWPINFNRQTERDQRFEILNWHKETMRNPLFVVDPDTNYGDGVAFSMFLKSATPELNYNNNPFKITVDNIFSSMRHAANDMFEKFMVGQIKPATEFTNEVLETELSMIFKRFGDVMFKEINKTLESQPDIIKEAAYKALYEGIVSGIAKITK